MRPLTLPARAHVAASTLARLRARSPTVRASGHPAGAFHAAKGGETSGEMEDGGVLATAPGSLEASERAAAGVGEPNGLLASVPGPVSASGGTPALGCAEALAVARKEAAIHAEHANRAGPAQRAGPAKNAANLERHRATTRSPRDAPRARRIIRRV
jgi:hypothetical protein